MVVRTGRGRWGPAGKNKNWRGERLSFAYFSLPRQRKVGAAPHRGNASKPESKTRMPAQQNNQRLRRRQKNLLPHTNNLRPRQPVMKKLPATTEAANSGIQKKPHTSDNQSLRH